MRRLVALDMPAGATFVAMLRRYLDAGDAILPVDQRLPTPARDALFRATNPGLVVTKDGNELRLDGGVPVDEGDMFVVATSGTTGVPRGVVLTQAAVEASARATSAALGVDPQNDHWLCCLPVAHVGGLSIITRALAMGTKLTVLARFDTHEVMSAQRNGVTLTSLVPTTLVRLGSDASAFRTILLGGSQIPDDRPANTVATYGMTESGSGVVYDGVALSGVEVRISTDGEIAIKAPMLLRCYRDGTDPKSSDGWFATGDSGEWSGDGRLIVHGRIADVIVTGGEKVWPSVVEDVIVQSPKVREVGVVGKKDPEWGDRVVAYVVCEDEKAPPSLEELRDLVRANVGGYAAPREIVVVAELPRTALGKLRRSELTGADRRAVEAVRQ